MAAKPVVAGADGSAESMRAVEWAAREAALRGIRLRIVAVAAMPPRMRPNPATDQHPEVDASSEVVQAHPGRVLAGASARADLVVLGRYAPGEHAPGVGSVTHSVLSHAHGPVVSVPEHEPASG